MVLIMSISQNDASCMYEIEYLSLTISSKPCCSWGYNAGMPTYTCYGLCMSEVLAPLTSGLV